MTIIWPHCMCANASPCFLCRYTVISGIHYYLCILVLAKSVHGLYACICPNRQRQAFRFGLISEPPMCCICLDEFTNPASLPCGHCFCLACIGEYWRIHGAYQCPLCKAVFPTRPQLKIDQTLQTENAAVPLKAGEVPCDFCPAKRRAVKSCLVCMASYCDAHLAPHYQSEDLGRHLLISVAKNLEDSVCRMHGKKIDRFCRSDRSCICVMCAQTEHRGHHIVSINREAARKKVKSSEWCVAEWRGLSPLKWQRNNSISFQIKSWIQK